MSDQRWEEVDHHVSDLLIADDRALQAALTASHELLSHESVGGHRVSATTIQTVGAKGYDAFTLALVGV